MTADRSSRCWRSSLHKIKLARRSLNFNSFLLGLVLGACIVTVGHMKQFDMFPRRYPHSAHSEGTELLEPPVKEAVEKKWKNCEDLVIIAGHAVYVGTNFEDADEKHAPWSLLQYQKDQLSAFLNHIRTGVEIAAKNEKALLMFSGGMTRLNGGPRTEAESYWWVADAHMWFGYGAEVRDRTITEDYARDSFENLMFSVCRFYEIVGKYPSSITVVSFEFKEQRFRTMHRKAIRWPESKFHYVGVDMDDRPLPKNVFEAEKRNSVQHFASDPYGCKGALAYKKSKRNPFRRSIPYPKACPEMKGLFEYCESTVYDGELPWEKDEL